jgi:putative metallohydrolase (TIGR04338 family)
MQRPRDNQRQKVYNAENVVPRGRQFNRVVEITVFVDHMLKTTWWRRNFPDVKFITVKDGRRRIRPSAYRAERVIKMPKWSRNELIVIHEVAHIVTPDCYAAHGPEYCRTYLDLVKRFMGLMTCELLRNSFKVHGVKWASNKVESV